MILDTQDFYSVISRKQLQGVGQVLRAMQMGAMILRAGITFHGQPYYNHIYALFLHCDIADGSGIKLSLWCLRL